MVPEQEFRWDCLLQALRTYSNRIYGPRTHGGKD